MLIYRTSAPGGNDSTDTDRASATSLPVGNHPSIPSTMQTQRGGKKRTMQRRKEIHMRIYTPSSVPAVFSSTSRVFSSKSRVFSSKPRIFPSKRRVFLALRISQSYRSPQTKLPEACGTEHEILRGARKRLNEVLKPGSNLHPGSAENSMKYHVRHVICSE